MGCFFGNQLYQGRCFRDAFYLCTIGHYVRGGDIGGNTGSIGIG